MSVSKPALLKLNSVSLTNFYLFTDSNLPPPDPQRGNCSLDGYLPYFDDCFKINTTRMTFDDARQACEDEGAALATVIDGFAEAFILANMLYANDVQASWIGFTADNVIN